MSAIIILLTVSNLKKTKQTLNLFVHVHVDHKQNNDSLAWYPLRVLLCTYYIQSINWRIQSMYIIIPQYTKCHLKLFWSDMSPLNWMVCCCCFLEPTCSVNVLFLAFHLEEEYIFFGRIVLPFLQKHQVSTDHARPYLTFGDLRQLN